MFGLWRARTEGNPARQNIKKTHSYQTCFSQVPPQMLSGWTWGTDSCWKCKSVSGVALARLALRPATLWKLIRLIGLLITLLMMRSYMHLSDDGDDNAYCWSRLIWLSVLLISSICILVTQVDTNLIIGLIGGLVSITFLIICVIFWRQKELTKEERNKIRKRKMKMRGRPKCW